MNDINGQSRGRRDRPTLRTVAELSGLAVTTVSRALGDAPDISAETKKKVREIADSVGYTPNRAGVRLRTGRTNVIALVLEPEPEGLNMSPRMIASIARGLAGTAYHLVMTPEMPNRTPLDAVRYIVETRSADAVIINKIQPEDPRVAYLRKQNFPFVTHGRTVWSDEHAYFDYDNRAFGRIAVETLVRHGRSHLLLLAPPQDQNYARDMIDGAVATAGELGVSLTLAEEMTSDSSEADIRRGVARSLETHPNLDALISSNPNGTMVATAAIEATDRALGKDFDVFSKETIPFLKLFRPQILTLVEDIQKAGTFLAKAAIHEIATSGKDHMQMLDCPNDTSIPL
ncbi:LacI family transcriptional regulator [Limimaricola soesokkakensis]|uniref:LacI family transcriptional regulator n=1 Tax=Limimaricola soesokkakensis TaxID=1343159 RepID=UPI003513D0E4